MNNSEKRQGNVWPAILIFVFPLGLLIAFIVAGLAIFEKPSAAPTPPQPETPRDYLLGILAEISISAENERITALRDRINLLFAKASKQELEFVPVEQYHMDDKQIVADLVFNRENNRIQLLLFVPRLEELQNDNPKEVFLDLVAATLGHVAIHLELTTPDRLTAWRELDETELKQAIMWAEAVATGLTIKEIVRPMVESGRTVDKEYLELSLRLAAAGDNPESDEWLKAFLRYKLRSRRPAAPLPASPTARYSHEYRGRFFY